jgi:glutamate synthase (NADPH/NADH) small chain
MGNPKGFIQVQRKAAGYRPLNERVYDFGEVEQTLNEQDRRDQASRWTAAYLSASGDAR